MQEDDAILHHVKADLARRYTHSLTRGRHSTPVEAILRLLVVKRLYQWSYEETEHFVGDSLVLRQFCRLYLQPVPDDTTLIRWAKLNYVQCCSESWLFALHCGQRCIAAPSMSIPTPSYPVALANRFSE